MTFLTPAEVHRVLGGIRSPRDLALFTLMYFRGLRASEPATIRRQDVDLDAGAVSFTRLKNSRGGRYVLQPAEIKVLTAWLSSPECPQQPRDAIFPIKRGQILALFKKYASDAGIEPGRCHPHVLKHSIATNLLDAGAGIEDVQDWLGHKNIQSTLVYARYSESRRRAAAKKFSGKI